MVVAIQFCGIKNLWKIVHLCEVHYLDILLSIFDRFNKECNPTKYTW